MKLKRLSTVFPLLVAIAIGLFSSATPAQTGESRRGTQIGNSYAISDIESINTTNGNVTLKIPLAQLPPTRGGLVGGVTLVYNSKLWDSSVEAVPDPQGQIGLFYNYNVVGPSPKGGWQFVSGYKVELERRANPYAPADYCGPTSPEFPYGTDYSGAQRFKMIVTLPDGNTREFVPVSGNVNQDGWSSMTPIGINTSCAGLGVPLNAVGPGMTYYSTDGSAMRLVIPPSSMDGLASNYWERTWTLYLPDGSRVEKINGVQKTYDRNGNYLEGLKDQFGRQITWTTLSNGDTILTQPGFGGEILTWTIKWKGIWVYKRYKALDILPDGGIFDNGFRELYQNLPVVDEIILPSQVGGGRMKFFYDAPTTPPQGGQYTLGWGNLTGYTLVSTEAEADRAKVTYKYSTDDLGTNPATDWISWEDFVGVKIKRKELNYRREHDGSRQTDVWTYSIGGFGAGGVSGPGGETRSESYEQFGPLAGQVFKTTEPDGTVVERLWLGKSQVKTEFRSIPNAAGTLVKTAIKDYTYDQNGNIRFETEYDYVAYGSVTRNQAGRPTGIPAGAVPVRTIETTYHVNVPINSGGTYPVTTDHFNHPNGPRNVRAIASRRLRFGGQAGTIVAYSEVTYDNPRTTANPTVIRVWDSTKGGLTTPLTDTNSNRVQAQYDSFGNPTLITDERGVQTQLVYGPVGQASQLYPTERREAFQTPQQRTTTTVYDFNTGLPLSTLDVENNILTTRNYDGAGRLIEQVSAVGTPEQARTAIEYNDGLRLVVTRSDVQTYGDGRSVRIQHADQLGRIWLTRKLEDPNQSATDPSVGVKVQTRWAFDTGTPANGAFQVVSNPYRTMAEPEMGWTLIRADKGGRVTSVQSFTGSALPAPWGANGNSTGAVTTSYDGDTTTVTDQAGKVRRSISDGLGRLIRLDEPNSSNQLGTVAAPNQATTYGYDIRNNLALITQGGQTRSFAYDSVGRLTSAVSPENGTTSYTYDAGDNLLTQTDSRGVVITNQYDVLDRLTQRTYILTAGVGATTTEQFFYDGAGLVGITPNYAKGRLTRVSNGSGSYEYRNFDAQGRVLSARQVVDGNNYDTGYAYNLAGQVVSQVYPSGRVVTNTFGVDAGLSAVSSRGTGRPTQLYASNFEYGPHGGETKFQYGNGLWEEATFNSRLQCASITLRRQATTLWNVAYGYGTTDNNGTLRTQTLTHPGIAQPLVQNYGYDSLNRLILAQETQNSVEQWKQTFTFDRFGNRAVNVAQTTPGLVGPNPVVNAANNRIAPQAGELYAYDATGNLVTDRDGKRFVFDANQRVVGFAANQTNLNNQVFIGEYRYDGEGRRVKKITGNVTTIFVYDAFNKLIGEYTVNAPAPVARTQYLTADLVSSQRVLTDAQGNVSARRDFAPYGEELSSNASNRQTGQGYLNPSDTTRQKFATYQRDEESGLDFAQSRFYASNSGRFTSAGLGNGNQSALNPQSWNRYIYVQNAPTAAIDPQGSNPLILIGDMAMSGGRVLLGQNGQAAASGEVVTQLQELGALPVGDVAGSDGNGFSDLASDDIFDDPAESQSSSSGRLSPAQFHARVIGNILEGVGMTRAREEGSPFVPLKEKTKNLYKEAAKQISSVQKALKKIESSRKKAEKEIKAAEKAAEEEKKKKPKSKPEEKPEKPRPLFPIPFGPKRTPTSKSMFDPTFEPIEWRKQ